MRECKFIKKLSLFFWVAAMILTSGVSLQSQNVQAAAKVSISAKKLTIDVGKSKTLTIKNAPTKVSWKLSTKKYVTIKTVKKNQIKITGKKAGATTVTATAGKKKYTCKVTVKNVTKRTDKEILKWIGTKNNNEALMKNNDRIAYQHTFYKSNEKAESYYVYRDHEQYVEVYDNMIFVDKGGDVYGYYKKQSLPYRYLFIGNSYQTMMVPTEKFPYEDDPSEKVLSQQEKNGVITVETVTTDSVLKEMVEYGKFQTKSGDQLRYKYLVDEKTGEINQMKIYIFSKDGTKTVLQDIKRVRDAKKYVVDQQIEDQVFAEDKRTITVTADPGTENERTFTQTVGKGCAIYIISEEGYSNLYSDAACTKVVSEDEDNDYMQDRTYYTKKET
ncbi:MAG: hypothetical protein ACI4HI_07785 [Lachnospiraceae bacterium]